MKHENIVDDFGNYINVPTQNVLYWRDLSIKMILKLKLL